MSEVDPARGKHRLARHRGPSVLEQTRDRVCDAILAVPTPSIPAGAGRVVAVTALGGLLSAAAVVGTQAAGSNTAQVARAGAETVGGTAAGDTAGDTGDRTAQKSSRDASRTSLTDAKQRRIAKVAEVAKSAKSGVITKTAEVDTSDPQGIARAMRTDYGWSESDFFCLDALWIGESNWQVDAGNPTSSAYGIPQALPGEKMASAGADWLTNPATQIEWGLGYIQASYGTPCSANKFKLSNGWY
ncbi:MAG: lytic transglycosylase domain-containing protein [Nocardioidaceae bacterium]